MCLLHEFIQRLEILMIGLGSLLSAVMMTYTYMSSTGQVGPHSFAQMNVERGTSFTCRESLR